MLRRHHRKAGDVLHPQHEPLAALDVIRQTLGTYNFAGQYQQAPTPLGGGMIQANWLVPYDLERKPDKFERVVQSWDTASKPTELSDYSVCATWGVAKGHFYLLNVLRKRLDYPQLKRAVIEQRDLFRPDAIVIEDKGSGISLIQDLIADNVRGVTRYKPKGDKMMRASAQTATIEAGFIHVPHAAPWLEDYIHELIVFPNGKFDDQVDATTQFLDWIRPGSDCSGWIEFYGREVAKMQGKESTTKLAFVMMRAPQPYSNYFVSGSNHRAGRYTAGPDGIIENVHPEDISKLAVHGCVPL